MHITTTTMLQTVNLKALMVSLVMQSEKLLYTRVRNRTELSVTKTTTVPKDGWPANRSYRTTVETSAVQHN